MGKGLVITSALLLLSCVVLVLDRFLPDTRLGRIAKHALAVPLLPRKFTGNRYTFTLHDGTKIGVMWKCGAVLFFAVPFLIQKCSL